MGPAEKERESVMLASSEARSIHTPVPPGLKGKDAEPLVHAWVTEWEGGSEQPNPGRSTDLKKLEAALLGIEETKEYFEVKLLRSE